MKSFEEQSIEQLNEALNLIHKVRKVVPDPLLKAQLDRVFELVAMVEEGMAHS